MASREAITEYIASLPGVDVLVASREGGAPEVAWGDTFFTYDPEHAGEKFPFATIVGQDYGDFDNASNLNRPGVFRLNVGVSKATFASLFTRGAQHDFTALDQLMPHPVYGPNLWVCVLNPSDATFDSIKPLLAEGHGLAVKRYRPRPRP